MIIQENTAVKQQLLANVVESKEISQKWSQKKGSCLWKLAMLLIFGLAGLFLCFSDLERPVLSQKLGSGSFALQRPDVADSCAHGHEHKANRLHYPQPKRYDRGECSCTPVHYFVVLSMQRSGSGWFETLINSHPNVSSHGEVFSVERRRDNMTIIRNTLDSIYNLDWTSSASKNSCTSAVGLKWMLNQGLMEYKREVAKYLKKNSVSIIFLFRRNILSRYVSILANTYDRQSKLLNGTHKAHVHTKEEAELLAAYKPIVNLTSLLDYLKRIEDIMVDAQSSFSEIRHTMIYYEDLLENKTDLKSVQEFLQLPPQQLRSKHVKIHTRPISDQIQNWEEVSYLLKGTRYESYIY